MLADYYHRKKFYDELEINIAALEEKYLITETLVRPAFYEGQIFYDSVSDIDRSMTENVNDTGWEWSSSKSMLKCGFMR